MDRSLLLKSLNDPSKCWDVIVIGGGASGLGAALDASSRGLSVLLLEQGDFAQETSSRSTKLVHGGVRYLKQARVGLVREALKERSYMLKNAPHLVHPLPFLLPATNLFMKLYYFIGIKLYDILAGSYKFGASKMLSQKEMLESMPNVRADKLSGGIRFFDGQFDDSRFAINLAETITELNGTVLNYFQVNNLIQENNQVVGVTALDIESGNEYQIKGKAIINATGVFVDSVRRFGDKSLEESVIPSQGAHIILDKSFFPGNEAMIIPETSDGRVLFSIPWHNYVLVGTTDIAVPKVNKEPRPLEEEIEFLISGIADYLTKKPTKKDILSSFAGLRPLIKPKGEWKGTSSLSRDYHLSTDPTGLITITGGKWTTYRKMGEDTVDLAIKQHHLKAENSKTKDLPIHGSLNFRESESPWKFYGSDQAKVEALAINQVDLLQNYHPKLPCRPVDVIFAVRQEMARKLQDVLARRTRCLFLDAKLTIEIAPQVVTLLAKELGKPTDWEKHELNEFITLAKRYLPDIQDKL